MACYIFWAMITKRRKTPRPWKRWKPRFLPRWTFPPPMPGGAAPPASDVHHRSLSYPRQYQRFFEFFEALQPGAARPAWGFHPREPRRGDRTERAAEPGARAAGAGDAFQPAEIRGVARRRCEGASCGHRGGGGIH